MEKYNGKIEMQVEEILSKNNLKPDEYVPDSLKAEIIADVILENYLLLSGGVLNDYSKEELVEWVESLLYEEDYRENMRPGVIDNQIIREAKYVVEHIGDYEEHVRRDEREKREKEQLKQLKQELKDETLFIFEKASIIEQLIEVDKCIPNEVIEYLKEQDINFGLLVQEKAESYFRNKIYDTFEAGDVLSVDELSELGEQKEAHEIVAEKIMAFVEDHKVEKQIEKNDRPDEPTPPDDFDHVEDHNLSKVANLLDNLTAERIADEISKNNLLEEFGGVNGYSKEEIIDMIDAILSGDYFDDFLKEAEEEVEIEEIVGFVAGELLIFDEYNRREEPDNYREEKFVKNFVEEVRKCIPLEVKVYLYDEKDINFGLLVQEHFGLLVQEQLTSYFENKNSVYEQKEVHEIVAEKIMAFAEAHKTEKQKQKEAENPKKRILVKVDETVYQGKTENENILLATASVVIDGRIEINNVSISVPTKEDWISYDKYLIGYPKYKGKDGSLHDIIEFATDANGNMTKEAITLKEEIREELTNYLYTSFNLTARDVWGSDDIEYTERWDYYNNNAEKILKEMYKEPDLSGIKADVVILKDSKTATKGLATVEIDNALKINAIQIKENVKTGYVFKSLENVVAFPSYIDEAAKTGRSNIVNIVNPGLLKKIQNIVLKSYDKALSFSIFRDKSENKKEQNQAQKNERNGNTKQKQKKKQEVL
ncbi:MAG: SpoVG family protein [Defluviitaleaceae bacterium]|nr:SpoVG family protein [Defluviitaleaceae bacterium]